MNHVIQKALTKARAKGLSIEDSAELIVEYLEIAGEIGVQSYALVPPPLPKLQEYAKPDPPYLKVDRPYYDEHPTKPVLLNKVITKSKQIDWDSETLSEYLAKFTWVFTVRPEGYNKDLVFEGTLVKEPKQLPGIAVVFHCVTEVLPNPLRDWPLFFPYQGEEIDPEKQMADLKLSASQALRIRSEKLEPLIPAPRNFVMPGGNQVMPSSDGRPTGGMI